MFKEILLPIDLEESEITGRAIEVAENLAERFGARLTVLRVIPDFSSSMVASYFPKDMLKKTYNEACKEMKDFIQQRFKNPSSVHCVIGEGTARKVIVKHVAKHNVDLVVLPARKHDISKVFLGSNSAYVVDNSPCTVMVVRP